MYVLLYTTSLRVYEYATRALQYSYNKHRVCTLSFEQLKQHQRPVIKKFKIKIKNKKHAALIDAVALTKVST